MGRDINDEDWHIRLRRHFHVVGVAISLLAKEVHMHVLQGLGPIKKGRSFVHSFFVNFVLDQREWKGTCKGTKMHVAENIFNIFCFLVHCLILTSN